MTSSAPDREVDLDELAVRAKAGDSASFDAQAQGRVPRGTEPGGA